MQPPYPHNPQMQRPPYPPGQPMQQHPQQQQPPYPNQQLPPPGNNMQYRPGMPQQPQPQPPYPQQQPMQRPPYPQAQQPLPNGIPPQRPPYPQPPQQQQGVPPNPYLPPQQQQQLQQPPQPRPVYQPPPGQPSPQPRPPFIHHQQQHQPPSQQPSPAPVLASQPLVRPAPLITQQQQQQPLSQPSSAYAPTPSIPSSSSTPSLAQSQSHPQLHLQTNGIAPTSPIDTMSPSSGMAPPFASGGKRRAYAATAAQAYAPTTTIADTQRDSFASSQQSPMQQPPAPAAIRPPQYMGQGEMALAQPQQQQQQVQPQQYGQPQQQQQQQVQQQPDLTNGLVGQIQNMSLGNRPPPVISLLSGPPDVSKFERPPPVSWADPSRSISRSPNSNPPPSYKRCTVNSLPNTPALANKCKLPLGLLITPYRHTLPGEEDVPLVNPETIVRCRRCRTYINPWVTFIEQGQRWKCNMCFLANDVPSFFDWDTITRQQSNRLERPELTQSVIEFIAPQEYMVRQPQPVVFLFVVDVTYAAVNNGMVKAYAETLRNALDGIPNEDGRTRIGFLAVDRNLSFFKLNATVSEPQMLVISDLEDPYLPAYDDLLVNMKECRNVIDTLLDRLPDMFQSTQVTENALGCALQAAYKLISPIGGKIVVLQSSMPNIYAGALKPREDPKLLGTTKESGLLQAATSFYKNLAVDCSRSQVSIDLFMFNQQYADVATLSGCPKFTGGNLYYYPKFTATNIEDRTKFGNEFTHLLSRPLGLEAVMRVRGTRGIRLTAFHGNFFLRSTDLLALPNVNPDNSYAVELQIEEPLTTSLACFQTAVLHTSSSGERRIRVVTSAVPLTDSLSDVYASVDVEAMACLLMKKGIARVLDSKIEDARDALQNKTVEILGTYKSGFSSSGQSYQLLAPESMAQLPLLTLGMLKSMLFRVANNIPLDMRAYLLTSFYSLPTEMVTTYLHPKFYALHTMPNECGRVGNDGLITLPSTLNLCSDRFDRHGLYLLDTGMEIFLWVTKATPPEVCNMLFGVGNFDSIPSGKTSLPVLENEFSKRIRSIVDRVRNTRLLMATVWPCLYVVKEESQDVGLRMWFLSYLVEDRCGEMMSYPQYLNTLKEAVGKFN